MALEGVDARSVACELVLVRSKILHGVISMMGASELIAATSRRIALCKQLLALLVCPRGVLLRLRIPLDQLHLLLTELDLDSIRRSAPWLWLSVCDALLVQLPIYGLVWERWEAALPGHHLLLKVYQLMDFLIVKFGVMEAFLGSRHRQVAGLLVGTALSVFEGSALTSLSLWLFFLRTESEKMQRIVYR